MLRWCARAAIGHAGRQADASAPSAVELKMEVKGGGEWRLLRCDVLVRLPLQGATVYELLAKAAAGMAQALEQDSD